LKYLPGFRLNGGRGSSPWVIFSSPTETQSRIWHPGY
jgi:hypothetical protein